LEDVGDVVQTDSIPPSYTLHLPGSKGQAGHHQHHIDTTIDTPSMLIVSPSQAHNDRLVIIKEEEDEEDALAYAD